MASNHAENSISNGSLDKYISANMQSTKHMYPSEPFPAHYQKVDVNMERNTKEAESTAPHPFILLNQMDQKHGVFDAQIPTSYVMEGNKNNLSARHYENSLFSSSLSDLFSRKMRLSSNNGIYGHSIDAATHYEEEEPLESLEEIEAQTIGNLLPDDDDLLAGVTDGLDINVQPGSGEDNEDMDLFSNVGGMDLGDDISSAEHYRAENLRKSIIGFNGMSSVENLYGELPSRTLFVGNIHSNVDDFELQSLFELYGDIHTLHTMYKQRGFVMVTYYDLRSACNAMKQLQNKSLNHMKFDIHFFSAKDNLVDSDINQGVVAVYDSESPISNDELHRIFGSYGEIKEVRETAQPSPRKFIEFYDIRAAEAALSALNRFDGAGKQRIKVELPRPGGGARRSMTHTFTTGLEHDDVIKLISPSMNSAARNGSVPLGTMGSLTNGNNMGSHTSTRAPISPFAEGSFHHGVSNSVPKSLPSLVRMDSFGAPHASPGPSHSPVQIKYEYQGVPGLHPHSLPDNHDVFPFSSLGSMTTSVPGSAGRIINRQLIGVTSGRSPMEMNVLGNGNRIHPGNLYSWNNSPNPHHSSMMLPNSPSFANGFHPPQHLHVLSRAPTHLPNRIGPLTSHHVGSAPAHNPSLWEMQQAFSAESIEGSAFHPGSLGNLRISNSSMPTMEFVPRNVFPRRGGSFHDSSIPSKGLGLHSHHQSCVMFPSRSQMGTMMNSFDSPNETIRVRRNESVSSQTDNKKQFELDIDRILQGGDSRTTLMIKNIPNKYTSKMLLAAIDERHKGTYDFIYLPIDFKNKCNVGYAFINMTEPNLIVPFYQAFNGKRWEKFNSEKVASIAYARIQGKAALVAHFQNSSLMNEDKRCRPILFNTDGPNAGDQVPFPMGVNIRSRMGKTRHNDDQGSPPSLANGEGFCGSDSSSGSARD